jgi:hypothetical protein
LYRPKSGLSIRTVNNLISYLPMESATATAMRVRLADSGVDPKGGDNPDESSWSMSDMLLASVVDELRYLQYTTVQVNSDKPAGQPPKPIPRPGTVKRRGSKTTRKIAEFLDPRLRGGDQRGR